MPSIFADFIGKCLEWRAQLAGHLKILKVRLITIINNYGRNDYIYPRLVE